MKREDLVNDPRVVNAKLRSEKIAELYELVSELVKDWPTNDLLEALNIADIPHGEATDLDNLENDHHLSDIDFFQQIDHPSEGKIKLTSPPVNFSKTPATIRKHAPKLGEHTVEILKEAGIDQEIIEEMISSKATLVSD